MTQQIIDKARSEGRTVLTEIESKQILKQAGISDEIIQAIIIFGSRDVNDVDREKAWEMLNNMGIIVDMREGSDGFQRK